MLTLMSYRSTPAATGYSPSEIMLQRQIRTTLPTLPAKYKPIDESKLGPKHNESQERNKCYFTTTKEPCLNWYYTMHSKTCMLGKLLVFSYQTLQHNISFFKLTWLKSKHQIINVAMTNIWRGRTTDTIHYFTFSKFWKLPIEQFLL